MKSLTLLIASVPDRENVVAEIWFGNDQVAEISNEGDTSPRIQIFSAPDGQIWCFDLSQFQEMLIKGKSNLKG